MGNELLHLTLVLSLAPRQVETCTLETPAPCTLLQALQRSGLLERHPGLLEADLVPGVWGRKTALQHALRDHDRVELYRPLRVDPKVARRERFVKQGARAAGLFARRGAPR